MKNFAALALGVGFASLATAQNTTNGTDYATGLLAALQAANLTTLLGVATQNAATLLPLIQNGNHTVFAPTDAAFAELGNATLSNSGAVLDLVSYHLVRGQWPVSRLSSNHTVASSALNATSLVNLPGGQPQKVVLTGTNTSAVVHQPTSNITSTVSTTYQNLVIHVIPTVLTIPQNLTATAATAGLSSLTGALQQYAPAAVGALTAAKGITVFAPLNAAFEGAASLIGTLNATQITNVLNNHVLNGTVAYSTLISNGQNGTTASGEAISFVKNTTGTFVVSGNITARIVQADVLVSNGVVHVIDQILANTASNPSAAASAASSYASVAATQTNVATTPTSNGTNGGASASASTRSSAKALDANVGGIVAGLLALGAAVLA